jgi:hypothetical protein
MRPGFTWGNRNADWSDFVEPALSFPAYTPTAERASLEIMAGDMEVYETSIDLKKGLSYYAYNLQLDSTQVIALEQKINADLKEDAEPVKIRQRDNGKYYLPVGKYMARLSKDGASCEFTIELSTTR